MNAEALIGTVLGTCTLQKLIGQGGMGAVFLAQQSRPNRQVAVKVLLPMTPQAPDQHAAFLERFRRETDVVASLEHPNIMPVHEYGERDGLAYLVMPYVSGGTLRDELEREGRLPLEKVVFYLEQMVAALELAHEHGVIHRDIKPANILVRREGRLLLTDFGLVKIASQGQSASSRLTGVGVPVGTPDYMAPEQVVGGEVDTRADLYSLGVILYQMVTGTLPFKGDMPMQVAMQHMQMSPVSPRAFRPDLPPAAEMVMLRALAKRPSDRYRNVQEFASAFRQSLITSGVAIPDFSSILAPGGLTNLHVAAPRNEFAPVWQGPSTESGIGINENALAGVAPHALQKQQNKPRKDIIGKTSIPMPSLTAFMPPNTPQPPAESARPAVAPAPKRTSPAPGRPVLGHKFNLRRPSDKLENEPVMPSPPEAVGPQLQDAQPPQSNLSSFAMPPEGSGLRPSPMRPPEGSGLRLSPLKSKLPSLSSAPSEKSGVSPSPVGLLGRSGLRPIGPMALSSSGVAPLPAMPAETAVNQPSTASPFENASMPHFPSAGINAAAENAAPLQAADRQANASPGIGQFNPPSAFPSAIGLSGNSTIQPLDGSAIPSFSGSTTQLPGSSTTQQLSSSGVRQVTGALVMGNVEMSNTPSTGNTGMMKLSQAAKVVQVPVAGQPGRYVTGLLPVLEEQKTALPPHIAKKVAVVDGLLKGRLKLVVLVATVVLVVFGSVAFFLAQSHNNAARNQGKNTATQNVAATATANATTGNSNVLMRDPLDGNGGNIHSLPLGNRDGSLYAFKGNAYHITANSSNAAIALLPGVSMPDSFTYTLTTQTIKGDETGGQNPNAFGLVFCFNSNAVKGNKSVNTFYAFEVLNQKNGEYEFLKYDDSKGDGNK
ncbi:MAG: protein kinase, partial [Ktedonobacteraceae bacterium]|nr:protein kinase [Ktedonobacteraceae bacterium]